jgi:hypothetical protein
MADAAGLGWSRDVEVEAVIKRIRSGYNKLHGEYDPSTGTVPSWLPGEFHKAWIDGLVAGGRPQLSRNAHGWHVRVYKPREEGTGDARVDQDAPQEEDAATNTAGARKGTYEKKKAEHKTSTAPPPTWPTPYSARPDSEIPMRRFLFGQHYIRGSVSLTAGPGGVGKSQVSLLEAGGMAFGCNMLTGEHLESRMRAWVWNAEDDVDEMERRVSGICAHFGINREDLKGWLFLDSGHNLPLELARSNGKVTFSDAAIAKISGRVQDLAIDVVIFDPLVATHGLQENDNVNLAKLVRALDHKIAKPCNCAIEIIHHTRKPGVAQDSLTADDIRGAGGIVYSTRSGRLLIPMSAQEAGKHGIPGDERYSYFRLERAKANMARRGTICWLHLIERPVQNGPNGSYGDVVTIPTMWTPTDLGNAVTDTVAAAIREEIGRGEWRRDQRAANWAGKLIGRRLNLDMETNEGKNQAKQVLSALTKKGVLKVVDRTDDQRKFREFVVPGDGPR